MEATDDDDRNRPRRWHGRKTESTTRAASLPPTPSTPRVARTFIRFLLGDKDHLSRCKLGMNFFAQTLTVSQAEKELRPLLLDEGCQVLSSFELNKFASLTYGDVVCDDMFEFMENIVAQPLNYTPLTVQKTLVVLKHVLVYGSEKCVNSGYGIGKFIESLTSFNTVLASRQQKGANAFFQRLQGGGVDRGGPVRDAAKAVHELLKNINNLQRIRNESASQNSLVPIGDDKVAFITDDVRHYILKKKIEQLARIEIRSNLAKSEGGFGGGYMTKDGKSVVGAAHGIEEMIKIVKREKKKFSDAGMTGESPEEKILKELLEEAKREKEEATKNEDLLGSFESRNSAAQSSGDVDLLYFGDPVESAPAPAPSGSTGDLLGDFGGGGGHATGDLLGSADDDLLGLLGTTQQQSGGGLLDMGPSHESSGWAGDIGGENGLLALASTAAPAASSMQDPFASMSMPQQNIPMSALNPNHGAGNGMGQLSGMMGNLAIGPSTTPSTIAPMEDRFAALDALASTTVKANKTTALDAKMAENRLLAGGFSSSSKPAPSNGVSAGMSFQQPAAPVPSTMPWQPPPDEDEAGSYPMGFMPSHTESMIAPGTGNVAAAYGGETVDDDEDNPWVMGGSSGSGLQPLGAAPAAPPPPPGE